MNDYTNSNQEVPEEDDANEAAESDSRETATSAPTPAPTPEELAAICAEVKARIKFNVAVKPVVFNFKTTKDENGISYKRDSLEIPCPMPNMQGLVDILEAGGPQLELLMDAVESVVTQTARSFISDDESLNATNFPYDKLTWEAIANMPKPERSGGGIAKEVWDDFETDYIAVMVEATGKEVERVSRAAKILKGKFQACKTDMEVLGFLVDQLTIYIEATSRADEFAGCVAFLVDKADKLMNTTPAQLLEAL